MKEVFAHPPAVVHREKAGFSYCSEMTAEAIDEVSLSSTLPGWRVSSAMSTWARQNSICKMLETYSAFTDDLQNIDCPCPESAGIPSPQLCLPPSLHLKPHQN